MSDSITSSVDMNLGKLQKMMEDIETLLASVYGVAKRQTQLSD